MCSIKHQTPSPFQSQISSNRITTPFQIDPQFEELYKNFAKHIKTGRKQYRLSAEYNFQLVDFTADELEGFLDICFNEQRFAFRVNISVGCILRNTLTGELRYYTSSRNNQLVFNQPKIVRNAADKKRVQQELQYLDLQAVFGPTNYPDSKWTFVKATNCTFYLTYLDGIPIGSGGSVALAEGFPKHLLNNHGLTALVRDKNTGVVFSDQLCFFR